VVVVSTWQTHDTHLVNQRVRADDVVAFVWVLFVCSLCPRCLTSSWQPDYHYHLAVALAWRRYHATYTILQRHPIDEDKAGHRRWEPWLSLAEIHLKPAVLAQYMWEESMLAASDFIAVQRRCDSEPLAIDCKRQLRWLRFKVQHSHDNVTLAKVLAIVAELIVHRELAGSSEAVGVVFLT
jgi:hypothetical protein